MQLNFFEKLASDRIVEQTILTIDGFDKVYKILQQQVILRGQSQSTFHNYIRQIALISLHYNCLPNQISNDQLTEHLTALAIEKKSPSRSSFKHLIYGLNY